MAETSPWIAIVDDDPAVLRALSRLLRSHAFRAQTYGSGQEFLAALPDGLPDCLIVDLQMPEMNGLELQQHLVSNGIAIPTILITAHGDVALHDRAKVRLLPAFVNRCRRTSCSRLSTKQSAVRGRECQIATTSIPKRVERRTALVEGRNQAKAERKVTYLDLNSGLTIFLLDPHFGGDGLVMAVRH